ncbi:MAG: hypothetical protein P8J24_02225 [Arenicellales bacterium]|nr:hypothetical protein [Arenicellales bacterium]
MKLSSALVLICLAAYLTHEPIAGHIGSIWLGYTLGGVSAGLVLFLLWFGIQKRRYGQGTPLSGWLSGHVYLGGALVIVATLHSGFELGPNLHSLTWLLMVMTVLSGVIGVIVYCRYPALLSASRGGLTDAEILIQMDALDRQCKVLGATLGNNVAEALAASQSETSSMRAGRRLSGRAEDAPLTHAARLLVERWCDDRNDHERGRELHALLVRKQTLLCDLCHQRHLVSLMRAWLYFHVPLSVGLLVAIAGHVFLVFFYW